MDVPGRYYVEVDVTLARPPRSDATIYFVLLADNGTEAELLACQWAQSHPRVVMAVSSTVTSWPEEAA